MSAMTTGEADAMVDRAMAWLGSQTSDEIGAYAQDIGTVVGAVMAYELRQGSPVGSPLHAVSLAVVCWQWGRENATLATDATDATT